MSHQWRGVPRLGAHINRQVVKHAAEITDVSAVILAAKASFVVRFGLPSNLPESYVLVLMGAALLIYVMFHRAKMYKFEVIVSWPRWSGMLLTVTTTVMLLLMAELYLAKIGADVSRTWLLGTFVGAISTIWTLRGVLAAVVRRQASRGAFTRSVAVVGAGLQAKQLLEHLRTEAPGWKRVVGVFDDRQTRVELPPNIPLLGDVGRLESEVRRTNLDEIIIALPWSAEKRIVEIVNRLGELPVDVYLGSDLVAYSFPASQPQTFAGLPAFHIVRLPFSGWSRIIKWFEDKVLAALLLIVLAPVMLAIAFAIRLDTPGPVLFCQQRYGFNNAPIRVFKFRSMYHEPEAHVRFRQAVSGDMRVTRVGKFLRQKSLDELPQLFNALEGTMSLVGPRPHPVELNEQFAAWIDGYNRRHRVKPGITGWAQVNDLRGETDTIDKMRSRIEHDIFYIENWSLFLDLRILAITPFKIWCGRNAC